VFKSLRAPIIGGVQLQVREPSDEWITWQEVGDLDAAQPGDRVFTLDRSSGEICFGDARRGRIPPAGASNIRLRRYTIGGGLRGNRPAGSISQLLSAVPAVESVINLDPAGGGLDAETDARMHAQASAWLRHRDRAVGPDDFADLALKASPEVARAYGVPGRDLAAAMRAAAAGTAIDEAGIQAGVASVIVLPHGDEARPQPSLDLLATVKTELDARRTPLGRLVVVGPCYAQVAVRVVVVAQADYSPHELAAECARCIARFLHPLHGGATGSGWRLGQKPHRSDLYGLLGMVDGVQEVRSLSLRIPAPAGLPFIVSAGAIDVSAAA
jgi:predicted phage baseplate assembly protein